MLKFFRMFLLRRALAKALANLCAGPTVHYKEVAEQIEATRYALQRACGVDPGLDQFDTYNELGLEIVKRRGVLSKIKDEIQAMDLLSTGLKESVEKMEESLAQMTAENDRVEGLLRDKLFNDESGIIQKEVSDEN